MLYAALWSGLGQGTSVRSKIGLVSDVNLYAAKKRKGLHNVCSLEGDGGKVEMSTFGELLSGCHDDIDDIFVSFNVSL